MGDRSKRITVYLDCEVYEALQVQAREKGWSISRLINEIVRSSLREDVEDLRAFHTRADESVITYQNSLQELHAQGKLSELIIRIRRQLCVVSEMISTSDACNRQPLQLV